MKQALMVTIVSIMLFAACSSNPSSKTQYYLLNSPTSSNTVAIHDENSPVIAITLLELPDYLKQPSLVLQLSSHQLHYSHFHMWAEPLQSSFTQALSADLNSLSSRFHYRVTPATNQEIANTVDKVIVINITSFHATHQSQAILVGTYSLQGKSLQSQAKEHGFNLEVTLNKNGYEHAVEQMRYVITQLAKKITNNLVDE
ncbi:membrane integrity-associated transporter subunit PqiC [Colwellia sp. BRX10-3]|uniref:PqiC family protein n=1 Tax=Colwellia sp. BRX10-3 TaxID=2759844 RepID=UPI0015F61A01|nr:PqiC family protein [Colwellia sp. BRX10-3]MBA6391936.1 membrane integrity-associated transporter subunit PqiC [Colwellia sp. BRX10-3]